MKVFVVATLTCLFATTTCFAQDKAGKAAGLESLKDRASYSLGLNIGNGMKSQSMDLDPDLLLAGIKDALAGTQKLTDDQIEETMQAFQLAMQAKAAERAKKNKTDGESYLATNAKKEGVKTTKTGLQYKVLKVGTGPKPGASDTVTVNYRGTLVNGKEFDSSAKHGGPATFQVDQVIPGWSEALRLMPTGSKWQLYIPTELAYGEAGMGPDLPGNSALIFDVELVSIGKPAEELKEPATPTKKK